MQMQLYIRYHKLAESSERVRRTRSAHKHKLYLYTIHCSLSPSTLQVIPSPLLFYLYLTLCRLPHPSSLWICCEFHLIMHRLTTPLLHAMFSFVVIISPPEIPSLIHS